MQNRLYVSNLVGDVSDATLEALGFVFVIMATDEAVRAAMAALKRASLHAVAIRVEVAHGDVLLDSGGMS